jgi:hypothetical protein
MSKKIKDTPDSEVFLLSFIGEMVQVLTDFILTSSQVKESIDGDMSSEDTSHPLIVEGYMLDSDDSYIYLGPTPDQIGQAIKKDRVIFIQVLDKKDDLSDIMDSLTAKPRRDMN